MNKPLLMTVILAAQVFVGCESDNPHFLPEKTAGREAQTPQIAKADLPYVNLDVPSDWKPFSREWTPAYGAAANGDVDEARQRVVLGKGTIDDVRYGWADYLYQQNRIKMWTPIALAAGVAFLSSEMSSTPPQRSSYEEVQGGVEASKMQSNRQAVSKGEPPPYPTSGGY